MRVVRGAESPDDSDVQGVEERRTGPPVAQRFSDVSARRRSGNSLLLRIFGDEGAIVVDLDRSYQELQICRGKDANERKWRTVRCPRKPDIHHRFLTSIRTGRNDQPDFARGATIQKVLDACVVSDAKGGAVKV